MVLLLSIALPCLAGDSAESSWPADESRRAVGRQIYLTGVLPSGEPVSAVVQGDIPVMGQEFACAKCHRHSGFSSSEGGIFVPPVAGSFLFRPREVRRKELWVQRTEGLGTRPAYTEETLARSIREGIDAAGRPLSPLMPRYALNEPEMAALIAYLRMLSSEPPPGVTETEIHFATVVGSEVSPQQRQAMLTVLNTYFRDKNAGTRHETNRARRAPWHKDWIYQAYRKWVLHVWELQGSPETWPAQLEAYYREQPVFALLSGIAKKPWEPIHEFCESKRVPCLFPNTDLPVVDESDFYSIYFSKGLILEAQVLAKYLTEMKDLPGNGGVNQVFVEGTGGALAARTLRKALVHRTSRIKIQDLPVPLGQQWSHSVGSILKENAPYSVWVFWLDRSALAELMASAPLPPERKKVFFSGTLLEAEVEPPEGFVGPEMYLIYPFALPQERDQLLLRIRTWFRAKGIEMVDARIQANTYFTLMMVGRAIKRIIDNFSREYLIERIEHSVDDALVTSFYPRVSLASEQRFASKGAYVLQLSDDTPAGFVAVTDWLIP